MATGRRTEKKEETKGIQGKGESVTESLAWRNKRKGVGESEEEGRKRGGGFPAVEGAKDRVGRNDRLSPVSGRKRMSMSEKGGERR